MQTKEVKKTWCGYKFNKWAKMLMTEAVNNEFKKPVNQRLSPEQLVKDVIRGDYKL